jgi:dipeptidase E
MRLLLLSNSSSDAGYLVHAHDWITEVLDGARRAVFMPFAGVSIDWDDYAARVRDAFAALGVEVVSAHRVRDARAAVARADAVLVGGGNTFALLRELYARDLLTAIRDRVGAGAPYVGWSAGSNVACPTIRTTNDMPVVEPPSLDALGLVPFQINPHYTDAVPRGHRGETRSERLAEFVALNPGLSVVGLPEGTALRASALTVERLGPRPVRLFEHGSEPRTIRRKDLGFLMAAGAW